MKKHIKGIIIGFLLATLIFGTVVMAAPNVVWKKIDVAYADYKIYVDGVLFEAKDKNGKIESFSYNGWIYAPFEHIARALGKSVRWDGNTNSLYIGDGQAPKPTNYSRTNPAPIGVAQTLNVESYSGNYTVTIKINNVESGDKAWELIHAANRFNDIPSDGKTYILASISATVNKINDDGAVSFSEYNFKAFSDKNVEYESTFAVEPKPDFSGKVFEGGTLTGYVVFLVDKADTAPKIVYGMKYDGSGGIWFSLK